MTTEINLEKIESFVENINVYSDGNAVSLGKESPKFEKIVYVWQGMLAKSHPMPAFGVSLNDKTVEAMKSGVWLEFDFARPLSQDGLSFEKLLVNVVPEWTGFNVIRYVTGKGYDGRCFYYDLVDHDMSDLYSAVTK